MQQKKDAKNNIYLCLERCLKHCLFWLKLTPKHYKMWSKSFNTPPPLPQVWTALLNYGYVGCIRDLFVDGQSKDIRRLAEAQRAVGVKPSCSREPPKQCLSNPCQHNGVCREGWNRYVCDCSGTGYLGRSCERGENDAAGGRRRRKEDGNNTLAACIEIWHKR